MFIKLTNAAKEHKGNTLVLNIRHIVSCFAFIEIKDGIEVSQTIVYGVLKDSWTVEESVNEVCAKIEAAMKGAK